MNHAGAVASKRNSVAAPAWPQVVHSRFRRGFSPFASCRRLRADITAAKPLVMGGHRNRNKLAGMLDVSDIST
jgi:hypothetical protein